MEQQTLKYPNRGITRKVEEYFLANPNKVHNVTDLAKHFGVDERAIQQTMSNLIREGSTHEVVIKARAWRLAEQPKSDKRTFTEIGATKSGNVLVEDPEGVIYMLQEL